MEPKVAVVDDDEAMRLSTQALLLARGYASELFASGRAFLEAPEAAWACILLDLRLPDIDGLEVLARLAARKPCAPILMMSGHGDITRAVEAMKIGATDFLEKPFAPERLFAALDKLARSQDAAAGADPSAAGAVAPQAQESLAALTPREREIFDLLVEGHTNKVVAKMLDLSPRTVEVHRARIKQKLGAEDLADLIRLASG